MKMLGDKNLPSAIEDADVAMSMDGFIDMASFPMISISTLYLTGPPEVDVGTSTSSTLNLFLIIAVERTIFEEFSFSYSSLLFQIQHPHRGEHHRAGEGGGRGDGRHSQRAAQEAGDHRHGA